VGSALRQHIALVTGGGRGIGRAICLRLAADGCRVAALARTESELGATVAAAGPSSAAILPIVADVTDDRDLTRAVETVATQLGVLSILVNNAGFATPRRTIVDSLPSDWDRTIATCLRAPMVLTRLVLPDMLGRRAGMIVNIASIAGKRGRAGEAAYAAAKFGILGFTQALREEVAARGIKVTAISPGLVDTALIPPNAKVDRGRFLKPADVAEVVYQVVTSPRHACPGEISIEPQHGVGRD
jgi:3-oxoacyl-[acyl-carrier protein] reductase